MNVRESEFSSSELFKEIRETAEREGVKFFEQYKDLVEDLIEEKRIYGFFSDHEDLDQIKRGLESRWPEINNLAQKEPPKEGRLN